MFKRGTIKVINGANGSRVQEETGDSIRIFTAEEWAIEIEKRKNEPVEIKKEVKPKKTTKKDIEDDIEEEVKEPINDIIEEDIDEEEEVVAKPKRIKK